MKRLVLALLLIATPAQAAVLWFTGAETGDMTEFTNVATGSASPLALYTGAYGVNLAANSGTFSSITGLAQTTLYVRMRVQLVSNTIPTATQIFILPNSGITHFDAIKRRVSDGKLIYDFDNLGTVAAGTTDMTIGVWWLLEVKCVISATVGGCEAKLNGNTEFSSFATNNSGITSYDRLRVGPNSGANSVQFFYDDFMLCSGSYCPPGATVARQGTSGSPTYTAWTKTGTCSATGIETCWSATPFSTAAAATSIVASDAQTMNVSGFGTTQAGHGTETIAPHDTINACKTFMIAKVASASDVSIRRRLNGVDTDTAKTLTTTDAGYDDGIWTTTTDILRDPTKNEIGAVHGAGINLATVEDIWEMCDFLAVTTGPRHRVTQ